MRSLILPLALGIGVGIPVLGMVHRGVRRAPLYTHPLLREGSAATEWLSGRTADLQTLAQIQHEALQTLLGVLLALTLSLLAVVLISTLALLLAHASARRPEMALHTALGAAPRRLLRDLLAEATPTVLLASGLGVAIGIAVACALHASWPDRAAPWGAGVVGVRPAIPTLGVFVLVPILAWLAPASVAWRRALRPWLGVGSRATSPPAERVVRAGLAVVQLAAALVLLTGAGLLLRGFASSSRATVGVSIDARDTLTAQLRFPGGALGAEERALLYARLQRHIANLPAVSDASLATPGAWVGLGTKDLVFALTGNPTAPGWLKPAHHHAVGPGFFQALGIGVHHGREFTAADTVGAAPVAVVNEAFVTRFRLENRGIGRSLQLHGMSLDAPFYTIVGVVENVGAPGIGTGAEPEAALYLSALQHPPSVLNLAVRTTADPTRLEPVVAEVVRSLAPGASITRAMTMEQYLARFRAPLRWFAVLFGALAGVAFAFAAAGLRNVMTYTVLRRTREIGIRMALGARPQDITRMILGQSLRVALFGVTLGLFGALPLARLLQVHLRGVEPFDPLLFAGIAVLLGGVALVAGHRPARRAASMDPQITLRTE